MKVWVLQSSVGDDFEISLYANEHDAQKDACSFANEFFVEAMSQKHNADVITEAFNRFCLHVDHDKLVQALWTYNATCKVWFETKTFFSIYSAEVLDHCVR